MIYTYVHAQQMHMTTEYQGTSSVIFLLRCREALIIVSFKLGLSKWLTSKKMLYQSGQTN